MDSDYQQADGEPQLSIWDPATIPDAAPYNWVPLKNAVTNHLKSRLEHSKKLADHTGPEPLPAHSRAYRMKLKYPRNTEPVSKICFVVT